MYCHEPYLIFKGTVKRLKPLVFASTKFWAYNIYHNFDVHSSFKSVSSCWALSICAISDTINQGSHSIWKTGKSMDLKNIIQYWGNAWNFIKITKYSGTSLETKIAKRRRDFQMASIFFFIKQHFLTFKHLIICQVGTNWYLVRRAVNCGLQVSSVWIIKEMLNCQLYFDVLRDLWIFNIIGRKLWSHLF